MRLCTDMNIVMIIFYALLLPYWLLQIRNDCCVCNTILEDWFTGTMDAFYLVWVFHYFPSGWITLSEELHLPPLW